MAQERNWMIARCGFWVKRVHAASPARQLTSQQLSDGKYIRWIAMRQTVYQLTKISLKV
jgi:hypothetical protein